jgi:acetylornithine deacetylase/succinyl-diaminopimelate desuccinylase-like protein
MTQATRIDLQAIADEAISHLQALLRIDTTNPPGNETAAAEYIAAVLRADGYRPRVIESAPGRGSVVARYHGTGLRPPLLLYGHTDIVTAEPQHWSHDPHSGAIAGGSIWGRGALDMKSTVAQQLMVMLLLARSGIRLARDVIYAATADEEAGGVAGMGYLIDQHPELIRAEYALSEGGGATMYVAGRPLYDIRTAEKGTLRFLLRARGEPGHGSVPRPETAVTRIAQAVLTLATRRLPYRPTATFEQFFAVLSEMLGLPPADHPPTQADISRLNSMVPTGLAQYLHAISHDTAVPTGIQAGKKINVIPGEAEAWIDGRYLPGQTETGFLAEIRAVIDASLEIEPISRSNPIEEPPGSPLYQTIERVMRSYAPEARLTPIMLSGATDAKHVSRLGASCIGFGPIKISETFPTESLVHGHNERVPIDGYLWGIPILHDIVTDFCL